MVSLTLRSKGDVLIEIAGHKCSLTRLYQEFAVIKHNDEFEEEENVGRKEKKDDDDDNKFF